MSCQIPPKSIQRNIFHNRLENQKQQKVIYFLKSIQNVIKKNNQNQRYKTQFSLCKQNKKQLSKKQLTTLRKLNSSIATQKTESNMTKSKGKLNQTKKCFQSNSIAKQNTANNQPKPLSTFLTDHTQLFYFSNKIQKISIINSSKTKANKKQQKNRNLKSNKQNSQKQQENYPKSFYQIMKAQQPKYEFHNPLFISANGKISAASDSQGNVWILGMIFPQPINLSSVLKKKIKDYFLGQKGIVIKTKSNFYVVNWDKINLPQQILRKISIDKKYQQHFEVWEQIIPFREDAKFLFTSKKNSVSMETYFYHIFTNHLIVYPIFLVIKIKQGQKIKGISTSKTHTLLWTQCGKLYSWGQNTLALGYTDFCSEQDQKAKQIQCLNKNFIISAVAGNHYSIALTSQGYLLEWGIKKIYSQKTNSQEQELIFTPRKIDLKQKVCCLKGNQDHYGIITFSHRLYVWGKKIPKKLMQFDGSYKKTTQIFQHTFGQFTSNISNSPTSNLLSPTLCPCSEKIKIIDFQMRQDYVFLIIADKNSLKWKNESIQKFWQHKIKNISTFVYQRKNLKNKSIIDNGNSLKKQQPINKYLNQNTNNLNLTTLKQDREVKRKKMGQRNSMMQIQTDYNQQQQIVNNEKINILTNQSIINDNFRHSNLISMTTPVNQMTDQGQISKNTINKKITFNTKKLNKLHKHKKHQSALQLYSSKPTQSSQNLKSFNNQLPDDKITKLLKQRISKQQYFKNLNNQAQMFKSIMKGYETTTSFSTLNKLNNRQEKVFTQHYMLPKQNKVLQSVGNLDRKLRNKTLLFEKHCGISNANKESFDANKKVDRTNLRYSYEQNAVSTAQQSFIPQTKPTTSILPSTHMTSFPSPAFTSPLVSSPIHTPNFKKNSKIIPIDHQKLQYLFKMSPFQQEKEKKRKLYQSIKKRENQLMLSMKNSRKQSPYKIQGLYDLKLNQVLSKKQTLCNDFFQSTLEKIEKSSLSFRKKQSQQTAARKQRLQRHQTLKATLFQFLVKSYVVKTVTSPLQFGRETKIKIFASNLKYNRIQKSVRRLFTTTRIKFDTNLLKQHMPRSYLKFVIMFKNFVHRWKIQRKLKLKKYCVQQVIKINLKNKIRFGVSNMKTTAKNLQKIGTWLQLTRQQKMKCLNTIWKRFLITTVLTTPSQQYQCQYNAVLANVKSQEQAKTFKQLYQQKLKNNPMLKIQNYLGVSPLFKCKMLRNCQKLLFMTSKKKQARQVQIQINKTQRYIDLSSTGSNFKRNYSKHKSRYTNKQQAQQMSLDLRHIFINQNHYILPYSKHFIMFKKQKHLQINVNEVYKQSVQWMTQQKSILIKIFESIIKLNVNEYQNKMYKYRREMALFIRDNYQKICEKRWKYIIEYNKVTKQNQKNQKEIKKKQNYLKKLLRTIGYQTILEKDILPQKHRILDIAREMKGSPKQPQKWLTFDLPQFRKAFKQYFQQLQAKTKSIKRVNKTINLQGNNNNNIAALVNKNNLNSNNLSNMTSNVGSIKNIDTPQTLQNISFPNNA